MLHTDVQSELAVDARGVARRFGSKWVLRGVSLEVRPGEVVGLLGENGSGKTTLLRILSTLLRPSAGTVSVFGRDVAVAGSEVRGDVSFLAHTPGLYDDLTALENLRFAAQMAGGSSVDLRDLIERVGLTAVADDRVRGFSSGMQRRLALARMILRRPRLLLLDEPYSNLDSDGIVVMNRVISEAKYAGSASIIVLHELAPAAGILDRTVTIVDGRVAGPSLSSGSRPKSAAGGVG
jgi:heme exporter protein A